MGKYSELAKDIVKHVGGKENVAGLVHCITRLRFTLKDEGKANDEVLKAMSGVVTVMKSGGQYQVVIGNHVAEVYDDVCAVLGMKEDSAAPAERRKVSYWTAQLTLYRASSSRFWALWRPAVCSKASIRFLQCLVGTRPPTAFT